MSSQALLPPPWIGMRLRVVLGGARSRSTDRSCRKDGELQPRNERELCATSTLSPVPGCDLRYRGLSARPRYGILTDVAGTNRRRQTSFWLRFSTLLLSRTRQAMTPSLVARTQRCPELRIGIFRSDLYPRRGRPSVRRSTTAGHDRMAGYMA